MSCYCAVAVDVSAVAWRGLVLNTAAAGLWPDSCCCWEPVGLTEACLCLLTVVGLRCRPCTTGLVGPAVSPTYDASASFSLLSLELMFIFEYSACKSLSFIVLICCGLDALHVYALVF